MPRARLIVLALCTLLALAGPVSAAELVDVTGVVTHADATPAADVEVLVTVVGSDIAQAVTSDASGAFSVRVEAQPGDTIEVRATGATVSTGPDAQGCTRSSTPTGRASVTFEALPLAPIAVVLDSVVEDEVCGASLTPAPPAAITPPPTDGATVRNADRQPALASILAALAMLGAASVVLVAIRPRRRTG